MSNLSLLNQTYQQTGDSKTHNPMGMRQMQERAFAKRHSQYLLIKSPPASGKSRAMMFLALDKLHHQGIKKAIIIVPEMSIGRSFADTPLSRFGFFADWQIDKRYNLCLIDNIASDNTKTNIFTEFMNNNAKVLICTHHTFRFGYDKVANVKLFDDVLLGIDEFHHISASDNNRLGAIVDEIMTHSTAHIVAMTGSYFRGDAVPILDNDDETKFEKVTYTYYEQLNGYEYLKSLSLDYKFYQDSFFKALNECLDINKKTIIHIPSVNSSSAEIDKYETVRKIMDVIGEPISQDENTGIWHIKTHAGKILKLADLVTDDDGYRPKIQHYLTQIKARDDMDIIIALGMAKEGFDWVYCEHVLTIGYRGSMTEVVQIIGRATRDCEGKTHAQFTNLVAKPDARQDDVVSSVNDMLKAISLSLLMEQVLAPVVNFRRRSSIIDDEILPKGTIVIDDGEDGSKLSAKAEKILQQDADEIIASISQNTTAIARFIASDEGKKAIDSDVINDNVIPQIIRKKYPELNDSEIDQVEQAILTKIVINANGGIIGGQEIPKNAIVEDEEIFIKQGNQFIQFDLLTDEQKNNVQEQDKIRQRDLPIDAKIFDPNTGKSTPNSQNNFIKMGEKFINVDKLPIDLIHAINPFANAYEVLSKSIDADVLKLVGDVVKATKSNISEAEATLIWPHIQKFVKNQQREPNINASDPFEVRMAQVLAWVRVKKAEYLKNQQSKQQGAN